MLHVWYRDEFSASGNGGPDKINYKICVIVDMNNSNHSTIFFSIEL